MKKNIYLVKSVLISMLTAVTISFASCSDDMMESSEKNNGRIPEGAETALLEPYGLTFHNFISDDDVQILNRDTTEISVSKDLAEKLGITSFVNHPLGIWQEEAQLPYARLALAEKEVGDRWILTVRPASVAEVVGNKKVMLNTDIYVNPAAGGGMTRAGGIDMPEYAAKYVDSEEVIHPAYIHLTDEYGYGNKYHTDGDKPVATRGADNGGYQFMTADELAQRQTRASARCSILSFHDKLEFDHSFDGSDGDMPDDDDDGIIENKETAVNVNFTSELDFDLNYFITIDGDVKWKMAVIPVPYVERFETGLDGSVGLNSQLTVGVKKEWKIKKDKLRWKLCSFNAYTFTFWVGPVPVCVQCEPELYMKVDGGVSGEARVGVKYEYANKFKGGVSYTDRDGWSTIREFTELKNNLELIKPEVNVHAELGFGMYLGMNIMIYGVAGPSTSVGPRIGGSADFTFSPFAEKPEDRTKLEAELKVTVNATAGAKLKGLGYELAEYTKTFELAGPWTLVKYPSDGSEHVVGSENTIDKSWFSYVEAAKKCRPYIREAIDKAVNMIKEMYDMNDEQALQTLLAYFVQPGETAPEQTLDNFGNLWSRVDRITNWELQQRYDDYQYQKHAAAGDTQWINEFNWRKICENLKYNHKWDHGNSVEQGLEDIHQWFLEEFHREPSMASADDMTWLSRVFCQYDIELYHRAPDDVYNALLNKFPEKYDYSGVFFKEVVKLAYEEFEKQYGSAPRPYDARLEQIFSDIWENLLYERTIGYKEKQKQEEEAAKANWEKVLSMLKSMNADAYEKYPNQATRTAVTVHKRFVKDYRREPTTSNEDLAILNAMFREIMEQRVR